MSNYIVVRDPRHGVKHYATLSFQVMLMYAVFIGGVFSVPAIQLLAQKVSDVDVERAVIGETAITIDIAKTDAERRTGLSGRQSMPQNHGLLFIFDTVDYHGIWMKDMYFSIDIIWINEFNEVIYIERAVRPDTFPTVFKPRYPAKFVLEVNAGFVAKHNIKVGDRFVLM